MAKSFISAVANYLGYSLDDAMRLARKAPISYKMYCIPKKKGGERVIFHPSKITKCLQYAIMDLFINELNVHESALAYKKKKDREINSPIRANALMHSGYKYSVRIDMKDFFPSIQPEDLFHVIKSQKDAKWSLDQQERIFLEKILFVRAGYSRLGLAIGAPSSPMISNAVMYEIDEHLSKYAVDKKAMFTRYADDIVFSTNQKGECKKFFNFLENYIQKIRSPKLKINKKKTIYSSIGSRRVVTGLYITQESKVSIGRKNKKYIKKLFFDLKNKKINASSMAYLRGYIAYIRDVEPSFYDSLVLKYGSELISRAHA